MKMLVSRKVQKGDGKTILKILEKANINPEDVVVKIDDEVALEEREVKEGDEIKIIRITSGG